MLFMNTNKSQWNLSPHNIIVRYPPLAGGKFLLTMLSYYEKFMYPLPIIYIHQIIDNKDLSKIKELTHLYAMKSIPKKEHRHKWEFYEVLLFAFYRFNYSSFSDKTRGFYKTSIEDSYNLIPEVTIKLLEKYFCFHVQHDDFNYYELTEITPNATIINLTDYKHIQFLSSRFKFNHKQSVKHLPLLESDRNVINFSMKNIFNKNKFFDDVSKLAFAISGNSNVDSKIEEYYDAYINIHKP